MTGAGAMARDGGTCVGGEDCVSLPVLEACVRDLGHTSFFSASFVGECQNVSCPLIGYNSKLFIFGGRFALKKNFKTVSAGNLCDACEAQYA